MISGSSWWPRPCAGASRRRRSTRSPSTTCGSSTASRTLWIWRTPWITDIWTATPCAGPRRWASPTRGSPPSPAGSRRRSRPCGSPSASARPSRWWTPAPPSSRPRPPITTPPTTRRTRPPGPAGRMMARRNGRCWCWAPAPSASVRASSSTTVRSTRSGPSSVWAMRPSSSTTTRRPCPPTSMWRISSTLSR